MSKSKKSKLGRPTDYSIELAAKICELIGSGKSLSSICRDDDMPSMSSVYLWLTKHEAFSDMYTRAREDQADTMTDQIVDIADEMPPGDEGGRTDSGFVAWQKNRIEARKWVAAKLKPRKYGDKVNHEHAGGVAINVITGVPKE